MLRRVGMIQVVLTSMLLFLGTLAPSAYAEDPSELQPHLRKSTTWHCNKLDKDVPLNIYYITRGTHSRPYNIGSPVIVYVKNHGEERIGQEPDAPILMHYLNQRYIVITVDFEDDPRAVSPFFDNDLHDLFSAIYDTGKTSLLGRLEPRQYRCFFLPAGCRVATDLVFWEIDKHGANGTLEFIMNFYNREIAGVVTGKERVSDPAEMTDRAGRPFQYKVAMDIVYPSQAKKKVPLVVYASTQVTRHPNVAPATYRPHTIGFTMRGYAYAITDHCYNPIRRHFWFMRGKFSLNRWNGLACNTAAIRFLRANAEQFNIDARYIGGMGHSKGQYGITRLSSRDHENAEEARQYEGYPPGSPEPQPWLGHSSRISVGYQSPGNHAESITADYAPTLVSHGAGDSLGRGYRTFFNRLEELDVNHVALLMKGLGHELPYGYDEELDVDRYALVHTFFDQYLKVEEKIAPAVLFITPRDKATAVAPSDKIEIQFAPVMDEASIVDAQGVQITRASDGVAVQGAWRSSRGGARFTFTPGAPLAEGEQYRVAVSTGVKNAAGTPLVEARVSEFTVEKRVVGWTGLREVNEVASPEADRVLAIRGATLIDGLGGRPVADSTVVVHGAKIVAAGPRQSTAIPANAEIFDAEGLTLLPGLIDAHFHIGRGPNTARPPKLLAGGVTSMRDPGRPIPVWDFVKNADVPMPRCFLTGPHFDNAPHAYPKNAILLTDPKQTRDAVHRFVDEGASAIKIYYRLPLDLIQVTCATAQERGVPVTAHLELVRADRAIEAGLNAVEHITSFGTSLAEPAAVAQFEAAVQLENSARRAARPRLWATLDLENSLRVKPLLDLIVAKSVVVSPTLFVMETREGDDRATYESVRGFKNMLKFVGMCHRAGARIVVGSHGEPPNAYCRELELLVECGLTPMEAILAGTKNNAAFLGAHDRLGAVAPGKLADLILVDGDPLENISAMRQVRRVMLNGLWVKP